ncbi:hypothetical protein GUJ93_ZPchr0010g7467 [Zizania palustris]|uniref:Uncharacterized protein n=1 Tax=Zizania palustris TaxID=103762 RepID=A0A8J6BAC1_ZIZPA|nr:hypothetical protein GUJ93_ZPchr0010g7467 [Zizania palustris]
MRKQSVSSSGAVYLCKLLLMVIALICTLHPAYVEGVRDAGRALAGVAHGSISGCIGIGSHGCSPPAPALP